MQRSEHSGVIELRLIRGKGSQVLGQIIQQDDGSWKWQSSLDSFEISGRLPIHVAREAYEARMRSLGILDYTVNRKKWKKEKEAFRYHQGTTSGYREKQSESG